MLERLVLDAPLEIRQWSHAKALRSGWAALLDEQLDWCTNRAFAARRAREAGVGRPEDYLQRVVHVDGVDVLCGIRFYGGEARRPFVELIAWTAPQIDLCAATRAAMSAYAAFEPTAARVFYAGIDPPPLAPGWRGEADQMLVAEALGKIIDTPLPPNNDRVSVTDADIDEAMTFVSRGYEALAARSPMLAHRVSPAGGDELADCRTTGRLMWWHVDGQRAGLIAARRKCWLGIDGYEMVEEVVAPGHAGQRTAAAAQRKLAESLAHHDPNHVLFGTIDFANIPSRRTASRVGRRVIAAWWFVQPEPK